MRILALVVVAALAAAAPAAAKEPKSVALCGPTDCITFTFRDELQQLANVADAAGAPAPAGPYYALTFKGDEGGRSFGWKSFYVPSTHRQVGYDEGGGAMRWSDALPASRSLLDPAVRKLVPFPSPTLASVRVDGREVSGDPQTYLQLFEAGSRTRADPPTWDWVPIDLIAPATTPWTGSDSDLAFSPGGGLVERAGVRVRVPDGVAAEIAAGRTLTFGAGALPWRLLAGVAAAAAAVALLAGWRLRRRAAPAGPTVRAAVL
jgi:hypothetical protein